MKLLERDREVLALAPTGNSANHVQGSTVHTGLDVAVGSRRKRGPSRRVRSLWTDTAILITEGKVEGEVGGRPTEQSGGRTPATM